MTAVQTIVTAAGDSRPLFLPAGFGRPKSLVLWEGRPVIARAIDSYASNIPRSVVAIHAGEDDQFDVGSAVSAQFPGIAVCRVPTGARGALASALLAMADVDPDAPLVVAAGDSMIEGGAGPVIDRFVADGVHAATIAFPSANPRWSYLAVNDAGIVRQVAEKQAIGPLATTGVFYFATARAFTEAATWCLVNNASLNGIFYVSTTLNYLVSRGRTVAYATIARDQYRSWSLPIDFTTASE